jgi:mannose-6-phosphate isomerase-like protein (cupin superfamily)
MSTNRKVEFQKAELADITAQARAAADRYAGEVLRSDLLSIGLYIVPAGGVDDQTPHGEDEVYYTVSGRGSIRVGESDHPVQPGTLLFVPAEEVHHFHDVSEDLVLVVFWAPPEGSVRRDTEEER